MREQIRVMGMQLNVGDSKRFHCPFCGVTHEKSLAITRTPAGLLYICFRAKCNTQGIVGDVRMEPIKNQAFVPQIITEPLFTLPEDLYNKYLAQYSLDYQDWNILYHAKVAPVCSINGTNITKDMLKLFKIIGVKHLILMLDGDAVAKAATIKKAIGPLFKSCRIIPLPTGTDPKDFSYRELEKLIYI